MWTDVIQVFQRYMGTGLIMIWFLAAVIYLFLSEKRKERRILFVYMPIILLLLYFNPLFAGLFCRLVGSEIYFRICWLLPVIIVIAYSAVCIFERMKGKGQVVFAVMTAVLIAVSGKPVYDNPLYTKAENIYHVPDSVVHICDAIVVPGREVMAVFPRELLLYVRQYSPFVCIPYGRNGWGIEYVGDSAEIGGFSDAMDEDVIDLEIVAPFVDARSCHYVIVDEKKEFLGNPKDYGWELFGETDGYVIYRNTKVPLTF